MIRPMEPSELGLVTKSFIKTFSICPPFENEKVNRLLLNNVLESTKYSVSVLDIEGMVVSFVISSPTHMLFAYTKKDYRRAGFFSQVFDSLAPVPRKIVLANPMWFRVGQHRAFPNDLDLVEYWRLIRFE